MAIPSTDEYRPAPTAVVTGMHRLLPDVVIALKEAGLDVHAAEADAGDLPPDLAPASIHCYVQMPPPAAGGASRPLARVRATAERLRERFDAVARVAPLLVPTATVLLVADDAGVPVTGALSLLADALEGDHPLVGVYALDPSYSPAEIAERARKETAAPPAWTELVTVAPELPYTDWRDEIFTFGD